MTDRVAIILPNYNMPEITDHLYEWIEANVKWPHDWAIVDDASDAVPPSPYTTVQLSERQEFMTALRIGQTYAEGIGATRGEDHVAYWFLTTSVFFNEPSVYKEDFLEGLMSLLLSDDKIAAVHPALYNPNPGLAWIWMAQHPGESPRRVCGVDLTATLVRASWWKSGCHEWMNPMLRVGWGLMMTACYEGRKQGMSFYVHDGFPMFKEQGLVEYLGRRQDRRLRDGEGASRMHKVLEAKYGPEFLHFMMLENSRPEWLL